MCYNRNILEEIGIVAIGIAAVYIEHKVAYKDGYKMGYLKGQIDQAAKMATKKKDQRVIEL